MSVSQNFLFQWVTYLPTLGNNDSTTQRDVSITHQRIQIYFFYRHNWQLHPPQLLAANGRFYRDTWQKNLSKKVVGRYNAIGGFTRETFGGLKFETFGGLT
jgi:hypothetical protein